MANFADLLAVQGRRHPRRHPLPGGPATSRSRTWSWAEYVDRVPGPGRPARGPAGRRTLPFHVGVLLDNVPEFPMWLGGAALGRGHPRRHQPDPAGRGAGPRHPPHRLPAHRHRARATGRCSTASTSGLADDRVLDVDVRRLRHGRGRAPRRTVGRPRRSDDDTAVPPALHLRHDRRAEGLHLLPGPPRPGGRRPVDRLRPRDRGLRLPGDAAVPLQRPVRRAGPRPSSAG